MGTVHLSGYQERDLEVVDYAMYELEGSGGLQFRGPRPESLEPDSYFACLGAAQTLGCFTDRPFPAILSEALGLPALNLGYGGAGPAFYLEQDALLDRINSARFAVLQVMSGRSESNSLFESGGLEYLTRRSDGSKVGANEAYRELLEGGTWWKKVPFGQRYTRALARRLARPRVRSIVAETRANWSRSYEDLIARIEVPVVLLWFSVRKPEYTPGFGSVGSLFGKFPQLVDRGMVEGVVSDCDAYVECVTDRGLPQPLFSRFTGEPVTVDPKNDRPDLAEEVWTHNPYYPSPEMHEDAAAQLLPACKAWARNEIDAPGPIDRAPNRVAGEVDSNA